MISFPWDSLVAGFDDETGFPLYDRGYSADQLRDIYSTFFSNGVFLNEADAFNVTPSSGMNIIVSAGRCCINGTIGHEVNRREMALQASHNTYDRIDTIVLRWNANIDMRNIDLYVKPGVAQAVPVRPTLTRNETVYELGIADIFVNAKAGAISAARITDTRLQSERCGAVTPFIKIDTTTFYDQVQAMIDERAAELQAQTDKAVDLAQSAIDKTLAGTLQNGITKLENSKVNRAGDTMTGDLIVKSGTAKGNGADNNFTGTMNTGTIQAGDKVQLVTNQEGGNIHIFSPSGNEFQQDCYDGNYRLFGKTPSGSYKMMFIMNIDGTPSFPTVALPVSSGGTGAKNTSDAKKNLGFQTGTVTISALTKGGQKNVTINFSDKFASVPKVIVNPISGGGVTSAPYLGYQPYSITNTGFSLTASIASNATMTSTSSNIDFNWVAIGDM